MKSKIKLFRNPEFGELRTSQLTDGTVLFCLNDICKALDITNPRNTIQRLNQKGVYTMDTPTQGGVQLLNFIDEPNLYRCIFQSRKEGAEKFQDWVFEEVLPSIRKTGGYITSTENDTPEMIMARALQVAQQTIDNHKQRVQALESETKEQEKLIEEQKPKVVFAESVMGSSNLILIRDFAKSLCTENFKIGQNRLYAWFREKGILNNKNMPYQNYVERGYFEVITRVIGSGEATITTNTTKITGAGQVYFAKKIRDTYKQE